jgi:site-specific recombinase
MTASALAGIIQKNPGQSRTAELIEYFARICRTQIAAALGNVIFVGLGAVLFSSLWLMLFHHTYLDAHLSEYVLAGLSPISSGTVFYAALTGVILWLGSLTGGWLDNFLAYHRIPRAIMEHPWGSKILGQKKLVLLANSISRNISGWGVSISLGFMLGMAPEIGRVTGLPLDVRHVTLNTGMMALASNSLGKLFAWDFFLFAVAGIGITFILNLSVSFYLALRVALGAFQIPFSGQIDFFKNLFRQFLRHPFRFFFPPAEA